MPLDLEHADSRWHVRKIGVVGPGIVGMPMAALLARARVKEGSDSPAVVTVVQRASPTSAWKVEAINAGRSPIGGVEPGLDAVVAETAAAGLLRATHDTADLRDADVVLVCVQTDKAGFAPDYGPMFEALHQVAEALRRKPEGNVPLVVFESTLAPSSMATVMRDHFACHGLQEGRDVLLGNSPNRVMPGRLVERVESSDKIVAGLHPIAPQLIRRLYQRIVTRGTLHPTNSLSAEIVKTLENAYRDVRIAFAAEVVRFCDAQDFDFYRLRDEVNRRLAQTDAASSNPTAVPSGGLLVPTVGVGGHCLPKDGILLWWRALESGADTSRSLILEARHVNDDSPAETIRLAERRFGSLAGRTVALMGAAYRFDSEDTRNSPTLVLARLLVDKGCTVAIHDPYVKADDQNLIRSGMRDRFTNDLGEALSAAEVVFVCAAHRVYVDAPGEVTRLGKRLLGVVDGCNAFSRESFGGARLDYAGIGRGSQPPPPALNERYVRDEFNHARFPEIQRMAATCGTGCAIVEPGPVGEIPAFGGFSSRLAVRAKTA
jgi:UDP-N-acetyl-D-mannosaminuronic acid dehydrogenase